MAQDSKIQWTDHTFNPWIGCTKISPACKFCYAQTFAHRYGLAMWGEMGARMKTADSTWKKPLTWNRKAIKNNTRYKVFCASLADIFDDHSTIKQEWRDQLWDLIRNTPNLDWQLLTKRPENYSKFLPADWGTGYKNVWLGVSAETEKRYNERVGILSNTPAAIRFISMEPLLSPVFKTPEWDNIDWVIIGGESGNGVNIRTLSIDNVFRTIDGLDKERVFFKQMGTKLAKTLKLKDKTGSNIDEYHSHLNWLKRREFPNS